MLLNIITITKDDIEGLKKTIESTRKLRENHDVEQIIVDGSRNDLRQEIEKSLTGEKNISCFWQKPSGRSSAFNYGIKVAKADWVWFLNGGDEVYSGLDAGNFLYLLSNNGSDAIIFQIENMQSKLMPKHPQMWALWPPLLSWIPHPSTLTRRELYDKYGYYDESLKIAMDYEFWVRCFSKDVVVDLVTMPISVFDQTGISNESNKQIKAEVRKIIRKYFWLVIKRWLGNARLILKSLKVHSTFSK